MDLRKDLRGLVGPHEDGPRSEVSGDSLIIDCRGCRYTPLPGSRECIRCMVACMCREGGTDRLVLRTGRDTEISGRAGRAIKEVASLRRWSTPQERPSGRCRGCQVSRYEVLSKAWDGFPDGRASDLASGIVSSIPDWEGCRECVEATVRALRQVDSGLSRIMDEMGGGPVQ